MNGQPITAAHVRALLARAGALGLTAPDGGSLVFALTDDDGTLLATLTPAELARLARRGCTDHPDGDCSCPLAGPPPQTDAYEPTDAQRRWVKTRDRTCRFPNCGQRVGLADLDHVIAHAHGGADHLHQPVLPVPQPPPAQDLRPRLAVHPRRRRHPARHHPLRRHPGHPTTRPPPPGTRTPGRTTATGRRPATLLIKRQGRHPRKGRDTRVRRREAHRPPSLRSNRPMTPSVRIRSITVDCADPYRLVQFWAQLTGFTEDPDNRNEPGDPEGLLLGADGSPALLFMPGARGQDGQEPGAPRPAAGRARTRDAEVERLLGLGATLVDDQRRPDGTGWVVLADPEGNEFCVERSDAERGT